MASWLMENFPKICDYFMKLLPKDYAYYATDLTKFTYKNDENFAVPFVQVGNEFSKQGVAHKVIQSKQVITMELDETVYGMPLKVTTVPVFDDDNPGEVVGTIGIAIRRNTANNLRRVAESYQKGMHEISAAIEETAASAGDINVAEQKLNKEIMSIGETADKIVQILEYIRSIADETKMLGLNAAIEAARAGEAGRGFGVVAEEIRKLSASSKETANQIRALTQQIEGNIAVAMESSKITLNASQEQAAAAQQITASIEELTSMLEELNMIAQEL